MKHKALLMTVISLLFLKIQSNAQFYTIMREQTPVVETKPKPIEKPIERIDTVIIRDTVIVLDSKDADLYADEMANLKKQYKNRKRNKKKLQRRLAMLKEERGELPALTMNNLYEEILRNNIKFPKIVMAQAILETGWFKSSVCRNKHNLFGLINPRTGDFYEFNHWTESVTAYYTKVQYKYKGGNYLRWLDKLPYAEPVTYVAALRRLLDQYF